MIKNDLQAQRAQERLDSTLRELEELEQQYSGDELEFWAGSIRHQADKLQSQLDEYNDLREGSLESAIEGRLREPVLLENIGELLGKLRIAANLTQKEMADRLGWKQSNLSRFESENYSSQTIGKVAEFVGALGIYLHVMPSLSEQPVNIIYRTIKTVLETPSSEEEDRSRTTTAIGWTFTRIQYPGSSKSLVSTGLREKEDCSSTIEQVSV